MELSPANNAKKEINFCICNFATYSKSKSVYLGRQSTKLLMLTLWVKIRWTNGKVGKQRLNISSNFPYGRLKNGDQQRTWRLCVKMVLICKDPNINSGWWGIGMNLTITGCKRCLIYHTSIASIWLALLLCYPDQIDSSNYHLWNLNNLYTVRDVTRR